MKRKENRSKLYEQVEFLIDVLLSEQELPEDHLDRIRKWFADPDHADIKAEVFDHRFAKAIKKNQHPKLGLEMWPQLAHRLGLDPDLPKTQTAYRTVGKNKWHRIMVRAAAILIPGCLLLGGYLWFGSGQQDSNAMQVVTHEVVVPENGQKQITPYEGVEVILNENSKLAYGNDRECTLEGEGYFNVTKSDRPFVVHTENVNVTVLGTEFNVQVYPNSDQTIISLYAGSIQLEYENGQYLLPAGHEFVYNNKTQEFHTNSIEAIMEPSWLSFGGIRISSLGEIFASIETKYGITIEGKEVADTSKHYSFGFHANDPIDLLLSTLSEVSGDFRYTIQGNTIKLEPVTP